MKVTAMAISRQVIDLARERLLATAGPWALELFGDKFCNFVGVQSGAFSKVVPNYEHLDAVGKIQ